MRRLKNTKRLISFVLAFVMVCSFIPLTAFATDFVASTFSVVSWRSTVETDGDSTKNIWCQFDSANGFGWGAFQPESAACIKLVKDGKTEADAVNIGIQGQNAFINEGDGYARVRYSQYWMNLMNVGGYGLPADGDYIIVEGKFVNGDNTITVPKTYIKLTASGDNLVASSTAEQPEELKPEVSAVQAGHMTEGQGSINANSCLFFTVTGSAIPAGNYKAVSESVIKIIRGDQEYSAAVQGRGEVLKSDGSSAYLDLGGLENEWYLSPYVVAGDILVVEGNFTNGTDVVTIDRSVIIIDENRTNVTFATEIPTEPVQAGHMTEGQGSINANSCLYFTVTGSAIPAGNYKAVSESVIKIIRGDQEYSAAVQGRGEVLKSDGSSAYLDLGGLENEWYLSPYVVAGDILVVEGDFTDGTNTVRFDKSVIIIDENRANVTFTTNLPTEPDIIEAGTMKVNSEHAALNNGGFYFTMDANELPYTEDWNTRYSPVNADVIKLVRGGETTSVGIAERTIFVKYGENAYYLDTGNGWFMNNAPLAAGDMLIVEGQFTNGTVTFHVSKSVIIVAADGSLTFAAEIPTEPDIIEAGTMKVNSEHAALNNGGFYFTMDTNELPYTTDWETRYSPVNADVIKLVRNGETTSVGIAERTIFVKYGENAYYLDSGNGWFMNNAPLAAGDMLIVEGQFTNGTVTFHVSKSYIKVWDDGSLTISNTEPTEKPTQDVIEAGTMKADSNHATLNNGGFYFTMDTNELPYTTDWETRYSPVNADVIKLVRNGETTSVGIAERTIFVKYGENAYYLDTGNGWFMNNAPLAAGDMLIVEGQFTDGTVTFHVSKSYIKVWDDGSLTISDTEPTEKPTQNVIEAGSLVKDPDNSSRKDSENGTGIYFTLPENEIPLNNADPWANRFMPFNADCIKLIRGGKTTSIGNSQAGTIVKYDATHYYIDLAKWAYQDAPLTDDDILLIGGKFASGGVVFNITPTYISFSEGFVFFSTEYPEQKPEVEVLQVGHLVKDAERNARTELDDGSIGIYFTLPQNNIPYASDWSVRYNPASADCIKLIRGGKTVSIGNTDAGTIVKYDATHYYIALDKWAYKDVPITADDILVIEGRFSGGDTIFEVSKTYISFSHGMVIFSDEYPTGDESGITVVKTGNMSNDERGRQDNVIYFRMDANSAPYKTDWSLRYSPVSADCVKLVRGGVTYNIGNPGRGTIIKFSATEYAIETSTWTMGNVVPIREGDVLIFEGEFVNTETGTVITIPKNYIGIYYSMPFFSTSYPSGPNLNTVKAGTFSQDARPMTKDGLYFNLAKNAASYNEDWSLRYSPLESANVKLIRNGQTMEIGIPNRGTIVKFSETEYYLETNAWSMGSEMPLQQGDILVLSGKFISSSVDTLLELDETYIFITKVKRSLKAVFAQPVETMEASKGETIPLSAKNLSGNVTWTSSNTERATVDENGNVTVLSNRGTVYIMATVDNSGYSWQINLYDDTQYGKIYLPNTEEEIVTAVWCDSFHEFDEETLTRLEEAGVNLLIGVNAKQVGKSGMKYLLDRAKKHGIAVIADLRDWNGEKLPIYCKHSNLKGFLMWDEPTADDIEALAEMKEKFDNRMPDGLTFYVTMGDQAYDINTLFDQDQLSLKLNPMSGSDNIQSDFFGTLDLVANKALKKNVAVNYMIPDSTSLTGEQQSWLNSVALTFGVKGLTNYTYVQTENAEEAEALYSGMKESCGKVVSWDDIYMSYGWLGISKVDVGDANLMLEKLSNDVPVDRYGVISTVTSEQDLLVGSFVNGDSRYAYMITNAGDAKTAGDDTAVLTMEDASVTIQLKSGEYSCVAVIRGGEISYVAVSGDNTFTVDIAANEGMFVIPMVK